MLPFCADFEEGRLGFLQRMPSAVDGPPPNVRLVTMLGNIFGNLRDEGLITLARQSIWDVAKKQQVEHLLLRHE